MVFVSTLQADSGDMEEEATEAAMEEAMVVTVRIKAQNKVVNFWRIVANYISPLPNRTRRLQTRLWWRLWWRLWRPWRVRKKFSFLVKLDSNRSSFRHHHGQGHGGHGHGYGGGYGGYGGYGGFGR